MQKNFRDTVEEFWDWQDIINCKVKADNQSIARFNAAFSQFLGVKSEQLHMVPSGRFALQWVLKSIDNQGRRQVLVPAFNCSVVADAIEQADLTIVPYDFSDNLGQVDINHLIQLLDDDVSAIIISHFFGVPVDFRELIKICRTKNIIIIEDCAHTLGGSVDQEMAGTLGDAAVFSFNYDKPISLGWGGALVVNNPKLAKRLIPMNITIPKSDWEFAQLEKFLRVMECRRKNIPEMHNLLVRILRKLKLSEPISYERPEVGVGALRAELGICQLARYQNIIRIRNNNAMQLVDSHGDFVGWWVDNNVSPAWLKQKILPNRRDNDGKISQTLQKFGMRVGNFNWHKLITANEADFPNAQLVANHALDVPVHQNMCKDNFILIVDTINSSR